MVHIIYNMILHDLNMKIQTYLKQNGAHGFDGIEVGVTVGDNVGGGGHTVRFLL
jgi:hypothetical protein